MKSKYNTYICRIRMAYKCCADSANWQNDATIFYLKCKFSTFFGKFSAIYASWIWILISDFNFNTDLLKFIKAFTNETILEVKMFWWKHIWIVRKISRTWPDPIWNTWLNNCNNKDYPKIGCVQVRLCRDSPGVLHRDRQVAPTEYRYLQNFYQF